MIYVSTLCLEAALRKLPIAEILALFSESGIYDVELGSALKYDPDLQSAVDNFSGRFIVHNYFPTPKEPFLLNPATSDPDLLKRTRSFVIEALEFCARNKIPYYSFHSGVFDATRPDKAASPAQRRAALDRMIRFVDQIAPLAESLGVQVGLENQDPNDAPHAAMKDADDIRYFLQRSPASLHLDLGHLRVAAHSFHFSAQELSTEVRQRIVGIHINDNNGLADQHLPLTPASDNLAILKSIYRPEIWVTVECSRVSFAQMLDQRSLLSDTVGLGSGAISVGESKPSTCL
jgi:sugar phosphate isomerase/epimerase